MGVDQQPQEQEPEYDSATKGCLQILFLVALTLGITAAMAYLGSLLQSAL